MKVHSHFLINPFNSFTTEDKITEKVYCYDHPSAYNNHDALAIAAMAGRNNEDPLAMASMMNNNQWMNNPFIYLVFLMMFGNGGFWGNRNGLQGAEIQGQLDSLRNQMADNQNSNLIMGAIQGNNCDLKSLASNLNCDFNQLQNSVCAVRSAIEQVGGKIGYSAERVINAANLGDMNIIQQLKDCCCQTQQNIIKMGYEQQLATCNQTNTLQNAIQYVATGVERGFAASSFQNAQDKCDIIRSSQDNTQRIIDTLNNHWQCDLQQRYNDARLELSQQKQNATLIAALKPAAAAA